jgi:hypothetical protein
VTAPADVSLEKSDLQKQIPTAVNTQMTPVADDTIDTMCESQKEVESSIYAQSFRELLRLFPITEVSQIVVEPIPYAQSFTDNS